MRLEEEDLKHIADDLAEKFERDAKVEFGHLWKCAPTDIRNALIEARLQLRVAEVRAGLEVTEWGGEMEPGERT